MCLKKTYKWLQQTHEKMLSITNHEGHVIKTPPHPVGWLLSKKERMSGEDVEKLGTLGVAGGTIKQYGTPQILKTE